MGPVETYLKGKIAAKGTIHLTLLDPEKNDLRAAAKISAEAEKAGTDAILLGGSTIISSNQVDGLAKEIKKSARVPLILFPGNISGVSEFADAIFFMSLLNSANPYFLIDAQALAAPTVKRYGIETLPLGYILMGSGGAAWFIGYARPIPYERGEIAAMYALAAQLLGMRFIYLDAGSGAERPIPLKAIRTVRKAVDIPLIVGGGIRSGREANEAAKAGASAIVTGTLVEEAGRAEEKIGELIKGLRER